MEPFIIDAHVHTGFVNKFFSPEVDSASLLKRMDQFSIQYSINLCSMEAIWDQKRSDLEKARNEYQQSNGRIFYLGFFDPTKKEKDLSLLKEVVEWPGFAGIKIHPTFSGVAADDERYEPVWQFAADKNLTLVAHTWSVSMYNPAQVLSTPEKYEKFVKKYPHVRFVMGHSGGRGTGRWKAVRMANEYPHVYMDIAGDIFCYQYFEKMSEKVSQNKILFGTDYPWLDHRSHLTRVFLARVSTEFKRKILRNNALEVFGLPE